MPRPPGTELASYSSPSHSHHDSSNLRSSTTSYDIGVETPDSSTSKLDIRRSMDKPARSGDRHGSLRLNKTRRKGGFLLRNVFTKAKSEEPDRGNAAVQDDIKGKRRAVDGQDYEHRNGLAPDAPFARDSSYESPLARVSISHVDGNNSTPSESSKRSSQDGSSRYTDSPQNIRAGPRASVELPNAPSPSNHAGPLIDPTQIVNMALNLSESRRRNLSGGQALVPGAGASRRNNPTALGSSIAALNQGGSLRQHLQQQRHVSRGDSPTHSRRVVSARVESSADATRSPGTGEFSQPLQISAATFARRDKAQHYIELGIEYLRVLERLPPLKPNSSAPGNVQYSSMSVPGSPHALLHRVSTGLNEKHELGREYNPLQVIRNRKLRARSRNPLKPDVEQWDDPSRVGEWVDAVEESSQQPGFRGEEKVELPKYPPETTETVGAAVSRRVRSSTTSKTGKARYDWEFTPTELLADAYWLEQYHNKDGVEDRHGHLIFPGRVPPRDARGSMDGRLTHSRSGSVQSFRRGSRDVSEPFVRSSVEKGRDSVEMQRRSIDERHGTGRVKHVLNKARRRRDSSGSDLSISDRSDDDLRAVNRTSTGLSHDQEYGALQLHMDKLIAIDTGNVSKSPPQLITPGTPDKWGRLTTIKSGETPETVPHSKFGSPVGANGNATGSPRANRKGHQITGLPDISFLRQRHRSEDMAEDVKASPAHVSRHKTTAPVPSTPSSAVPSREASPGPTSAREDFAFHRSNTAESKKSTNYHVQGDVPSHHETNPQPSRQHSFEPETPARRKRHLFPIRTNDSSNSINQDPSSAGRIHEDDTGTLKEPSSAVRRFFKAGRLGQLVRNEGSKVGDLLRKRDSGSNDAFDYFSSGSTELLEGDDTDASYGSPPSKQRPYPLKRAPTSGTITDQRSHDSIGKQDGRSNLPNLPSFRRTRDSPHNSDQSRPGTPNQDQDHISVQHDMTRRNRSPRFDRLAPPGLDLSRMSTRSGGAENPTLSRVTTSNDTLLSRTSSAKQPPADRGASLEARSRSPLRTNKHLQTVIDQDLGRGRSISHNNTPPASNTHLSPMPGDLTVSRRGSKSAQHGKRHWSISDADARRSVSRMRADLSRQGSRRGSQAMSSQREAAISKSDIESVRALMLCSGIRAAALVRLSQEPRIGGPPEFLREAFAAAFATEKDDNKTNGSTAGDSSEEKLLVPRLEEHPLATQYHTQSLTATTSAIQSTTQQLRSTKIPHLQSHLTSLHSILSTLTSSTLSATDGASAFAADVTSSRSLEVRRVLDQVDKLARTRRRRLRWLRRIGFGLVEYAILGLMWSVWLVVVVIRAVWGSVKGVGRGVRWVLWL